MLRAALIVLALASPVAAGPAEDVLAAVNSLRAKAGCPALAMNAKLVAAAKGHARDMAEQNFFSHTGKDGAKFSTRIKRQGYSLRAGAENIAVGQSSASEVVQNWMQSKGHRRNILNCDLLETGIAVVHQPDDKPFGGNSSAFRYYWVQVFASP